MLPRVSSPREQRAAGRLERLFDVRPEERGRVLWAALYHFCLMAAYYCLRPVREEIGSEYRELVDELWLGTAVCVSILAPLYAAVAARVSRRRLLPWTYQFFALCFAAALGVFALGDSTLSKPTELCFYVGVSVFVSFGVSVFWAFMADVFDATQCKRLFGILAAAAMFGQLAGSGFVSAFAAELERETIVIVAIVLLQVAVLAISRLGRVASDAVEDSRPAGAGFVEGVSVVFRSPYLLAIAGFILTYVFGSAVLYLFKTDLARQAFEDRGERRAFFGRLDLYVSLVAILPQLFLTGRFMLRRGLGLSLAALPALGILGFGALAIAPVFWVLVAFEALRRALNFVLSKPSREALFAVVPRAQKFQAKPILDTAVYRWGDVGSFYFLEAVTAGFGLALQALVALPMMVLGVVLGLALGRMQERATRSEP